MVVRTGGAGPARCARSGRSGTPGRLGGLLNALLADYAGQLWPLNKELEALFEDWLPRLRAALGTTRRPRQADPAGDPDGYSGLSRRGKWERLVVSEWALALEVPDEFVRRAVMGEQLFLQLDRVVPVTAPETRVWVDCGPRQLGAPRLAHLALLVVLQRRSDEAGGDFAWAPLHTPEQWHTTVDPKILLRTRTRELAAPDLTGPGDRFVIGASCRGARSIAVHEVEGGLAVKVGRSEISLSLPEMPAVAQILKRPEGSAPKPVLVERSHGGPLRGVVFTPGGGVLITNKGERVEAWAVPRQVRKNTKLRSAEPWHGAPLGQAIGVGWSRRRQLGLREVDGGLRYTGIWGVREMPRPTEFVPPSDPGWIIPILTGFDVELGQRGQGAVVRDGLGMLWLLDFGDQTGKVLGRAALQPMWIDNQVVWIEEDGRCMRLYPQNPWVDGLPSMAGVPFLDSPVKVVSTPREARAGLVGCWDGEVWRVGWIGAYGTPRTSSFSPVHWGGAVDGVLFRDKPILITHDDQVLRQVTPDGVTELATFGSAISAVAVGGRNGTVAAVHTQDGWVHFVSDRGVVRLSFLPEGP